MKKNKNEIDLLVKKLNKSFLIIEKFSLDVEKEFDFVIEILRDLVGKLNKKFQEVNNNFNEAEKRLKKLEKQKQLKGRKNK